LRSGPVSESKESEDPSFGKEKKTPTGSLFSELGNGHKTEGLGWVRDSRLDKFGRALRLRWLWQERVDGAKPWVGMDTPPDDTDRALFTASTRVTVGDGHKCRF
jgi:hypothetical protein